MNTFEERNRFLEEENNRLKAKLLIYESENLTETQKKREIESLEKSHIEKLDIVNQEFSAANEELRFYNEELEKYRSQLESMVKQKNSEVISRQEELEKISRSQEILIKVLQIVQSVEDLPQAMMISLAEIGKYAGVSRVHVFEKSADGTAINNTLEWCNEGIEPIQHILQNHPIELAQSWFDMFEAGEYITASDNKIFLPEISQLLIDCGVLSIAVFPLTCGGEHYGFVDFNECSASREWDKNEIELLRSLSQIISTTQSRFQAITSTKLSQQTLLTVMNNVTSDIVVTDLETMKILFVNENMKRKTGSDVIGLECWKVLQTGQNGICSFCKKNHLLDANKKPTGVYHYEKFNDKFQKYMSIDVVAFEWIDGRIAQMEISTDITNKKNIEKELIMERDRLKAIGDNFPGGSLLRWEINPLTLDVHYSYVSSTWTSVSGLDIQKTLDDITYTYRVVFPEDLEVLKKNIRECVKTLEHINAEIRVNLPSGEIRWLQISAHPHYVNDKRIVADGFILDISERKYVEKELEKYYLKLEELVQERTEELETAYEEMEATNEELEQYKDHLEQMVEQKTRELTDSQERLISLSNNLPGGVIFQMIIDMDNKQDGSLNYWMKFMYVSDTLINLLGIYSKELLDDSSLFFEMILAEDKEKFISMMSNPENNDFVDFESRFFTRTNEIKWIHFRAILRIIDNKTWVFEGFMLDNTDRKKTDLELNEYRKQQNVLIKVLQIVQSSENLETAIHVALCEIGKYADVSRTYIFEKSNNDTTVDNTFEWCNIGVMPEKDNLQQLPIELMQRWFEVFENGEFIYTSDINQLPPKERDLLNEQSIKSILVLPLAIHSHIYGFVGFDNCSSNREWAPNEIKLLLNLSQIISDTTRRFNAENAILLSQQTMRTVLDNLDACVYVAKFKTGEILFANKQLKEIFGSTLEGKECWNIFGEQEHYPESRLLADNQLDMTISHRWENKNIYTNRWYYCIDSAIEWIDGQIVRLQYATDISDRKKAEESLLKSEELYRLLTVASPDAILVIDVNLKVKFISDKTKELFRLDNNTKLEDLNILDFMHFPDYRYAREFFINFIKGGYSNMPQLLLQRFNGADFYGEISAAPVKEDNKIVSFVMVIRDVTERKQIELDIIRAKEKAEEADFLKSAFLANMSHEIRTPMNGILGFAALIQLEVDEDISPRTSQYAHIINDNCQSLLQLLDDIIDISKLESKQMKLVLIECNLNALLSDLHLLYDQILKEKGKFEMVEIILDLSPEDEIVMVDSIRIQQVVTNLVSNAIKFTESGTINFGFERQDEEKILFYVRDSGIGIHKKYCDIIFERFRQVDENRQMNIGGTGLGLAISKNLVEIMGGEIWVESELGVGSTFYFTIKAKRVK